MDGQTPIIQIKGIGKKTEKQFHKLDIETAGDLLHYYPRNYDSYKEPIPIERAKPGELCAVRATIAGVPNFKKVRNLTILNFRIKDSTGAIQLTYFNMPYLKNTLKNGEIYIFRGMILSSGNAKVMEQAKIFSPHEYTDKIKFIQPVYSLTKGLTNQMIQKAVKQILTFYSFGEEYYPPEIIERYQLLSYKEALSNIHFPIDYDTLVAARKRIVFDEFFDFMLMLQKNKEFSKELNNRYPMVETADTIRLLEQMPYSLTGAQQKVWEEIKSDLSGLRTMNRLIQGDVGSGKTIIALLALLMGAANGYQGAMMAPTEVLAGQHFGLVKEYTKRYRLPFRPVLLVGSMTAGQKKKAYEEIETGEANIVIGTHALIQDKVKFQSLALVVTDEQHRFGVRQRETLTRKGEHVHILVMSATPIPRTLAIILYGDLQISTIDQMPEGRLPVKNCVVNTTYRPQAYEFIQKQVEQGHQAYVICPMVEAGELEHAENVMDYTKKLMEQLPGQIRIASLHGKMPPKDKNMVMEDFAAHNTDILVSTTVVEVGINVPNATVMIIENAERFGLAQLHQLRGRIGRGRDQSYCIFISTDGKKETMERLDILNKSNDGFYIANQDLKLRGPGDLFGIRQSGDLAFQMGDIFTDANLLKQAQEAVNSVLTEDVNLSKDKYRLLRRHIFSETTYSVDFRSI